MPQTSLQLLITLIDSGQITPAEANNVLDAQRDQRRPIGQLALESRLLSVSQIFRVLARGADTGERFGESAIALGFLSPEQVALLLVEQKALLPSISELLVELDLCDAATVAQIQQGG